VSLFSRTKTTYQSSTVLIFDDKKGLVKSTVLASTVQNQNIAEALQTNLINGIAAQGRAMYAYGKRGDINPANGYYLGLPSGSKAYIPTGIQSTIKLIIEAEIGHRISLINSFLDKNNAAHYAHEYMQANYDWDSGSNIVSNPPFNSGGATVTFDYAEVVADNTIKIFYAYGAQKHEQELIVTDLTEEKLYYYATYYLVDNRGQVTGEPLYWRYQEDTGVHYQLNVEAPLEDLVSPYYPIVPLRQDKVDLALPATRNEAEYQSSKQCLRYIGVNIDDLVDSVNDSPDIGSVDHAYVMLGIDVASEEENSKLYLFEFFNDLRSTSSTYKTDYDYWFAHEQNNTTPPVNTLVVADAKYRMELSWNYISRDLMSGNIAAVGSVVTAIASSSSINNPLYSYPTSTLIIRKQIDTSNYIELQVKGLQHLNYVYGSNAVMTTLEEAFSGDDEKQNFIIPLNQFIARNLGTIKSYDLMYDAIRIVFNSKIVTKLKWYQTNFFKLVVTIVAVAVAAYGYVQGGMGLLSAIGIATIEALILNSVLNKVAVQVADLVGEELSLILAIVATAYGVTINTAGISVAGTSTLSMLNAALYGTTGLSNLRAQGKLRDLQREMEVLKTEQEEFDALYETLPEDPLTMYGIGSEYTFSFDVVADSPTGYYTQAIHTGNAGILSVAATEYYVDSQLRLDLPYSPIRTRVY